MLIGDLLMGVRSMGPDNPLSVLSVPTTGYPSAGSLAGGILPVGTYYVQVTQLNPWGESLPSSEQQIVIAGGQTGFTIPVTPSVGATEVRVYLGNASGQENYYMDFPSGITPGVSMTLAFTNLGLIASSPPVNPSAFLPDSDGGFVTAATMYRWLNEALKASARATGGIQDVCGVASVSGMRRYVVPGQWLKFNQCFYDGWELDLGNKAETFRNRNLTASIAISLMVDAQSDTTRIELYWTPSRTSGATTTSAPIVLNSFNIPINTPAGWALDDGYASVNDGTNQEVVSYSSQAGNQLTGCIHGWSGTQPYAFDQGAVVQELNIEINGYRMPATYSVGQSAVTLGVPPGWEPFLKDYMLGLFRGAEQETDEGEKLKASALKGLGEWAKSNKPVAGPRQCRMYGDTGMRGLYPAGQGIIIP